MTTDDLDRPTPCDGWRLSDLLATPAVPLVLDSDLLEAVLPLVESVPNGAERLEPGAAFAPGVDPGASVPLLSRVLAMLGRDPAWSPPTQ